MRREAAIGRREEKHQIRQRDAYVVLARRMPGAIERAAMQREKTQLAREIGADF